MTKPHMVEKRERISLYYLTLDELMAYAIQLRAEYGPDSHIDFREEYGVYESYVVWNRPENMKEKADRLKKEEDAQDLKRRQYARLKKEFGDE